MEQKDSATSSEDIALTDKLIGEVLSGNVDAFGEIVQRHQLAIRAYLGVRLSDRHAAEDLAQEVFVLAFRKLESFDRKRPIGAWLRGIASNLMRNYVRKRREVLTGETSELDFLMEHETERLNEAHDPVECLSALQECLEKLDGPSKEIVTKRYLKEHSISELCKEFDRKHSAMTMSLFRIRASLRDCIEKRLTTAEI